MEQDVTDMDTFELSEKEEPFITNMTMPQSMKILKHVRELKEENIGKKHKIEDDTILRAEQRRVTM
eukprot:12832989-Heterocapsa_arctica.AAC.1